ncbi:hypothetical protein [Bradyrhizobium sp. AUGA SZCCT0431]|uniref:hypothetical protein n=1 Tax=Bradyrhizobium sp. AUGA SZCCT0431 TaxID=2807674 RepID=UPI001BA67286|nr:hypothetical protein [Bradyrhizobium sp. AUGA SZCCT0431]MBR1146684.1 hypothetical protein [Bradyrhizobium sp. AUGA SZCCT0431]
MNLFDWVRAEEANYKTGKVTVSDGYEWSMYDHIRRSTLYRDSKFTEGANDGTRPYKNIIRRIITLQHVATGFDVKDIEPFVNDSQNFYKSFLTRKYHPKWARKHNLDTFIDEGVESYCDFGLWLSKHVNKVAPEVVPLQSIAFCDQTDVLSGPICIRHEYSPAQLQEFKGKWKNIDEVIWKARAEKKTANGIVNKTPGKFIEAFELDGMLPKIWETDPHADLTESADTEYTQQFHMITYYSAENGDKTGISLYHGKGDPKKYKAVKRDPIFGRACGFGGIEELFEAQVWTNYDEIRIQGMLDAVSKVLGVTDDATFAAKNKLTDMENGEWLVVGEGKTAKGFEYSAVNFPLFEKAAIRWEEHAQGIGSASDAQLGENPTAGTPFKLQELVTYQGKGPHEYRKGKLATHLGEQYRDWILGDLVVEMNDEQEFVEECTTEELQYIADCLSKKAAHEFETEIVLSGGDIDPQATEELKQKVKDDWLTAGGSKRFFKLLKDDLKDLPVDVDVNIAGKQKNLAGMADKLGNVWRQIFANPQGFVMTMQIPGAAESFNDMLEASGLSPFRFTAMSKAAMDQMTQPPMEGQPPQQQPLQVSQPVA